ATASQASPHAGFQARGFGHHRLVPWRIEHEVNVRLGDGRDHLQLGAHVVDEDLAHAATGRGQCHAHANRALSVLAMLDVDVIDETEFHDVDRDLRIETGAKLFPYQLLDVGIIG